VGTGSRGTAGAAVTAIVVATTTATSYCDPAASAAPRGGSLAAAAPSAVLDTLDERRLIGTDVPDLSTLAGARSGTIGAALSTQRQEFEPQPFETRASGEATAYLKVEKPRFLFLERSPDALAAAGIAATAIPDASAVRTGASVARVAPSVDRLVAGTSAPAPGACSSAASATLYEGGAGSHLSRGPAPRRSLPPLSLSTTNTPRSLGERVPAAHAARIPRPSVPGAPTAGSFAPSCAPLAPAPTATPRVHAWSRGVGGSDHAAFTVTLCWEERNVRTTMARRGGIKEKGESPLTGGASGSITNDQRSSSLCLTALRLMARLASWPRIPTEGAQNGTASAPTTSGWPPRSSRKHGAPSS
jgi:hypothetical protein